MTTCAVPADGALAPPPESMKISFFSEEDMRKKRETSQQIPGVPAKVHNAPARVPAGKFQIVNSNNKEYQCPFFAVVGTEDNAEANMEVTWVDVGAVAVAEHSVATGPSLTGVFPNAVSAASAGVRPPANAADPSAKHAAKPRDELLKIGRVTTAPGDRAKLADATAGTAFRVGIPVLTNKRPLEKGEVLSLYRPARKTAKAAPRRHSNQWTSANSSQKADLHED